MHKNLLNFIILFILYGLINTVIVWSDLLTPIWYMLIITLIILVSYKTLDRLITSLMIQTRLVFVRRLEKLFSYTDRRLNQVYAYYDLIEELKRFFDRLCKEKQWAFYVFGEDSYVLTAQSVPASDPDLPLELSPEQFTSIGFSQRLDGSKLHPLHNLDFLVILDGKTRPFGLFFSISANFNFLSDEPLAGQLKALTRKAGQVLENTALYADIAEKNRQIKKIFEVSQKILSTLNTDLTLKFVLDALDEIIPFNAAVIFLFDAESKKLYRKVSKGYDDDDDLTLKLGQGACGWVAAHRKVSLLEDVNRADNYYPARKQTQSQIAIPLEIHDELIGVLCLESDERGYFTQRSLEILTLFANQAAIALNNAKQYEILQTKQDLEHELIRAGKIQQVLLPIRPPSYPMFNIAFDHKPSAMVSGDLFDLAPLSEDTLGLIIGDVSGKGADAAIMMSVVLAGFRAYKKTQLKVCEVVARLNNLLFESIEVGNYVTFFYAYISAPENKITYTNAGHNPPFLVRADGTIIQLDGGGIVLGYLANQTYTHHQVEFIKGDVLVCYTDGITEALNAKDIEFGENRLKNLFIDNRQLSSFELKEKVFTEVKKFTGRKNQTDDMTLVIVKYY